jgi:thiol-disulfide isomerase/thioredoxin
MSKTLLLSTLISFGLLFTACSENTTDTDTTSVNEDANSILSTNEFTLTSLDKKEYTIKKSPTGFTVNGMKDKVIILDIFATWCPPCQAEASHLTSLQKKYKDSLFVVGVTVEQDIANEKLENFKHEYNAEYTFVNSSENSRLIDAVAVKLKLGRDFGIPLMAMYKNGVLINYYQGATEEEFIESDIKKALGI